MILHLLKIHSNNAGFYSTSL
uniref:Uncharacterized protein n=1 Tax=Arundo donax TaxID=35708 RepID=A0A0A9AL13_ARUDO